VEDTILFNQNSLVVQAHHLQSFWDLCDQTERAAGGKSAYLSNLMVFSWAFASNNRLSMYGLSICHPSLSPTADILAVRVDAY
jgi:hypothetical protein